MPDQVEWRFYVHGDGRYASLNDGRTGDTLLQITHLPSEAYRDIAKVREFEEYFRSLPTAIRKQCDEELRERLEGLPIGWKQGADPADYVRRDQALAIFEEADDADDAGKCVEREKKPEELAAHIAQAQEDVRDRGMCGAIYDDPGGREVMCIRGPHAGRHFREADDG